MKIIQLIKTQSDFLSAVIIITISRLAVIAGTLILNAKTLPNRYLNGTLDAWAVNWNQWDAGWYTSIALLGYDRGKIIQQNFAFFPGYPTVIRVLEHLSGMQPSLIGLLISNLFFIIAIVLLYLVVKEALNKRVALISTIIMAIYPTSFIFSGVMTESMFLMLLLFAIFFAQKKRWILSGLALAALSGTRNIGILALIPIGLLWLDQQNFKLSFAGSELKAEFTKLKNAIVANPTPLLTVLLAPAGLLAFMYYGYYVVGDPLAFVNAVKYWGRQVDGNLIENIIHAIVNVDTAGFKYHIFNVTAVVLTAISFIYAAFLARLKLWVLSVYIFLLLPLVSGLLISFPRYTLVVFPIFIVCAIFIQRHRYLGIILASLMIFAFSFLSMLYTIGSVFTV